MTKEAITNAIAAWLKKQPFQNVMSLLLLGTMSYLFYYTVSYVIPEERAAIEAMADRIEEKHGKQIDRVCEAFERGLDRIHAMPNRSSVASRENDP